MTIDLAPHTVPTRWWHALDDGRVQCDVCPRACKMREGQRGVCFVRGVEQGEVVLLTYGRSSGFCVDPIEKKPLNHFLPGTPVLSFGTAGCNLACRFCQNWDISKSKEVDTLADAASPEAIAAAARAHDCRSVAFTYNDPTIFIEYAADVADACRDAGLAAVAVTAGYICDEPRRAFYEHIDAANVDLKGFTEDFYRHVVGGRLEAVLETLEYLHHETDVWLELTTLLIPGQNDSDAEIDELSTWVATHLGPDVPLHFTAFHPDYKLTDLGPTPPATLTRARGIAQRAGLHYVYTGNIHDPDGSSTYCPGCGQRVIERDWYVLGEWRLGTRAERAFPLGAGSNRPAAGPTDTLPPAGEAGPPASRGAPPTSGSAPQTPRRPAPVLGANGYCDACGCRVAGRFEREPGSWGARRVPVVLGRRP